MKRRHFLLSAVSLGVTAVAAKTKLFTANEKILIVYYSWSGNTRVIANRIQEATGGDLFEVIPEKGYPADYNATVEQAKKEIANGFKPPIKGKAENIEEYDVIFVGTPNWWSTMAPPMATFLTEHNLAGKKVIPFCTHGGGGKARCFTDIAALCPDSTYIPDGFIVSGNRVSSAGENVKKWLKSANY